MKAVTSLAMGNGVSGLLSLASLVGDLKYPICPGSPPALHDDKEENDS